jgi:photosystem II stability/assembly factor-like uncharacterized protein
MKIRLKLKYLAFMIPLHVFAQWTPLNSNTTNTLNDVYFVIQDTGFVVGNNGDLLKTIDAGANWTKVNHSATHDLRAIYFPSKQVGYMDGLKTVDGGMTWSPLIMPNGNTFTSAFFISHSIGFFCHNGTQSEISKAIDGGITWSNKKIIRTDCS